MILCLGHRLIRGHCVGRGVLGNRPFTVPPELLSVLHESLERHVHPLFLLSCLWGCIVLGVPCPRKEPVNYGEC